MNSIAACRRTRHQVAAHQSCIIFVIHSAVRSILLPRIQKRAIHCCWSELCARFPCTTNWSLASTSLFGFPKEQALCAPNDFLGNRYQAIVTRVGIMILGRLSIPIILQWTPMESIRRILCGWCWKGGIRASLVVLLGTRRFRCGKLAEEYVNRYAKG